MHISIHFLNWPHYQGNQYQEDLPQGLSLPQFTIFHATIIEDIVNQTILIHLESFPIVYISHLNSQEFTNGLTFFFSNFPVILVSVDMEGINYLINLILFLSKPEAIINIHKANYFFRYKHARIGRPVPALYANISPYGN